ncbi:MAG: 4Fe-4S binding protein [Desulfobacterales bacterium]|nr:4Fe-4S binding protein [Desulfobacterales bacterium]
MKILRNILKIDEELCNGCGNCVPSCAEGAIQIIDGKAKLVEDKFCDGLGACIGGCPTEALKIIEREAEDFDVQAVHEHLSKMDKKETTYHQDSNLSNWPVKIRLISEKASFLKNASLLIMADCVPVAFPTIHRDMLNDKVIMIGCPKFDNAQSYIEKFVEIFKYNNIKDISVVHMEVPCCLGLLAIVKKAIELSEKNIPMKRTIISPTGRILTDVK